MPVQNKFTMFNLTLITLLFCASALAVPRSKKPYYSLENSKNLFEMFIRKYHREYDDVEKHMRFEVFTQNLIKLNEQNMDLEEEAVFGINKFTDMTEEEFRRYTGFVAPTKECELLADSHIRGVEDVHECRIQKQVDIADADIPESIDWRKQNVVSSVKNQKNCGSCWTFGTTGNVESMYAIKYGKLLYFSEQQLVDCDENNKGCNGGTYNMSFGWLVTNGGMMLQEDYPYMGFQGECKFDKSKVVAKVKDCIIYDLQDEEQLRSYLANNGPVAISINANDLKGYTEGIITKCRTDPLNHAVLAVGYGTDNGTDYWIIKNSWGNWGERGYFRLKRNINGCGIVNPCAATAVIE